MLRNNKNVHNKKDASALRKGATIVPIEHLKETIDKTGKEFNIMCDIGQKRMNNGASRQDYKKAKK